MPTKCFQLILCDEQGSYESMSPQNSSPIFLNDSCGRFALADYLVEEYDTGGLYIKEGYENAVRYIIIQGNPVDACAFITGAIIVEWEII